MDATRNSGQSRYHEEARKAVRSFRPLFPLLFAPSRLCVSFFSPSLHPVWLEHDLDALVALLLEYLVGMRRLVERNAVRDDEGRVDVAVTDVLQEAAHVARHVRLAHLEGEGLGEGGAEVHLVEEAA